MLITIEDRELKKLVNSLVMGVLKNLGGKTKVADREGQSPVYHYGHKSQYLGILITFLSFFGRDYIIIVEQKLDTFYLKI